MNLKNKLFAGLTALSVVAMSFVPAVTFVSVKADSAEDMAAYTWAFDEGLTTMTSFDAFMFENAINREQAARFLVKGAEALGIELSSDQTCDYKDLASADQSLVEFINEGCELGLFKAQADFNPKQLMTREQAELVVARMVYGMDEVNAYAEDAGITEFAAARELLMADEIVKVEIPAQSTVKRGHLLLMLYRLADADVVDPTTPTVNPGHAEVSLVNAASTQEVPNNAIGIKVGTIKLTAGQNSTKVASVVISREGLGKYSDIEGVWFANSNMVTDSYKVTSSETATVRFSPALELAAGSSVTFDVLVALKDDSTVNSTHEFDVKSVNVSNGTASGAPFSLGTIKTTSYEVDTVDGDVVAEDVDSGKANQDIATVTLTPNDEANIKGFVLNEETAATDPVDQDLNEIFANVKAYYNDAVVGSVSVTDDKIVVSGLSIAADDGEGIEIELRGDVTYVGEEANYKLSLDATDFSSVTVLDDASGYGMRLTNTDADEATLSDFDLTLTKVKNATSIAPATSNAVLYEATLKSSTDFTLTKFSLEDVFSGNLNAFTNEEITLYVDGVDYDLDSTNFASSSFTEEDEIFIDAGRTVTIKVVGSTKSASSIASLTDLDYQFEFSIDEIENADGDTINPTISKKGDKFTIESGTAEIKKATVAAPTTSTLYSNGTQEIGRFAIKGDAEELKLKEVTFTVNGTVAANLEDLLDEGDYTLVNVADNAEVSSTVEVNGNKVTFKSMNFTIAKDATVNFKVMADFTDVSEHLRETLTLSIAAKSDVEIRNSSTEAVVTLGAVAFKSYTFGVQPPVVTLAKLSDDKFKVTIKNADTETGVNLESVTARVRILAADADYTGTFCLNTEGSDLIDCTTPEVSAVIGAIPGSASVLTLTSPEALSEDGGEISYEILVDSSFINPAVLKAEITALKYNGLTETYDVSAQ